MRSTVPHSPSIEAMRTSTVPTALQRLGDFSQTFTSSGQLITIYDPLTTRPDPSRPGRFIRDPFPRNRIPAARLNPVALALLGFIPSTLLNARVSFDRFNDFNPITYAALTGDLGIRTPFQSVAPQYPYVTIDGFQDFFPGTFIRSLNN